MLSAGTVRVSDVALALYRTYRPGSLAEVIGQEHVTEPLARALDVRPYPPRVPVLGSARVRQDVDRPHPGPVAELRAGADRQPVW